LRSITDRYVDFFAITRDALLFAANAMDIDLTPAETDQLLDAYLRLAPWPDSADALRRLHDAGIRVITITNFSPTMLRANVERAGLTPLFDALLSTDANHTYKPDPRAYQLGVDFLKLDKRDIVFAAFGAWDAAGAKSFGYPTVWVNRLNQPREDLGVAPDRTVTDLNGLLDFALKQERSLRGAGARRSGAQPPNRQAWLSKTGIFRRGTVIHNRSRRGVRIRCEDDAVLDRW
jgi:2-haloacid dehalogenase